MPETSIVEILNEELGHERWQDPAALYPGVTSNDDEGITAEGPVNTAVSAQGPVPAALIGQPVDPDFHPTYTYTSDDIADGGSYYGASLVHFETWTPTENGVVLLLPPADDGVSEESDFYVFEGATPGVDVPGLDGSGSGDGFKADAYFIVASSDPRSVGVVPVAFTVTAGTTYTLAAVLYVTGYGDPTGAVGSPINLANWVKSSQVRGGQATLVPWVPVADGELATNDGYAGIASGTFASARNAGTASGDFSDASGEGIASGEASSASSQGNASGDRSNATSGGTASGKQASASSQGVASGELSDARSFSAASGKYASATSRAIASGEASHASNGGTASGKWSSARGFAALADMYGEDAHASDHHRSIGSAQGSHLQLILQTANATPTPMALDRAASHFPVIPTGYAWRVQADVVAAQQDTPGVAAGWSLRGMATRADGTLRLIGATVVEPWKDGGATAWDAALAVDGDQLQVVATGEAATSIYWTASLHIARLGIL